MMNSDNEHELTYEERRRQEKYNELRHKEEEASSLRLADKMSIPYADLANFNVEKEALEILDEASVRHSGLAVMSKIGANLKVAVKNPKNPQTMLAIENLKNKGFIVDIFLVSQTSLEKIWGAYAFLPQDKDISGSIEITPENLEKLQEMIKYVDDFKDIYMRAALKNVTALLELLIAGALSLESSDIHIEPQEDKVVIRFRIDGMLQEIASIDSKMYKLLNSRLKLLSGMKINISNTPQDGRFSITTNNASIEVRTSALPGPNGESLVMRVLNPKTIALTLENLGLSEYDMQTIKEVLQLPDGLLLVTGPTGSGKTTTLYSCLKKINTQKIKIITVEDPIEYHVDGISQSQVNPDVGYTFASALRSILRQDPNVILVGEIRDIDTADIALHAALTGHLVFSTLHTNDAPSAILRLIDMKLSQIIIAAATRLLIAQRLVRKVCKECSFKEKPSEQELKQVKSVLAELPPRISPPVLDDNWQISRVKGCKICNGTGYKGRVGVYEMFKIGPESEKIITSSPTQAQMMYLAKKGGMVTMKQDGFLKVALGLTTVEEVLMVTG